MTAIQQVHRRKVTSDNIDPDAPFNCIIDRWGGLTQFCLDTQIAHSTVWNWQVKGYCPPARYAQILEISKQKGRGVKPADFVTARPVQRNG